MMCENCNGTGSVAPYGANDTCLWCHGSGEVQEAGLAHINRVTSPTKAVIDSRSGWGVYIAVKAIERAACLVAAVVIGLVAWAIAMALMWLGVV